jgi:hypothetical protein
MKMTQYWFESVGARPIPCILWDLLHVEPYDINRPDILHTKYIGMFDHLIISIKGSLHRYGKAVVFDEIWAGIPPYSEFYHCAKPTANFAVER